MTVVTTTKAEQRRAIRRIESLARTDVGLAGGKGANLGELARAGLPVPPGFVVTAAAYAAFCTETGVRERIAEALDGLDPSDLSALDTASERARSEIAAAPMPEWLVAGIDEAYAELEEDHLPVPVAVRSSATSEDTGSSSFAGMNESFLNVRGADAVVDAVRDCWASLFGARTIAYGADQGLDQAATDIAVVVQRQVDSTRAGVMFTVDPSSGRTDRIVIEAARGLGESVVSGAVSPDRYVVDKPTMEIVERELHHQELVIDSAVEGGGTTTRSPAPDELDRPVLDDHDVTRLTWLALEVEHHYGSGQDTEWAFDADQRLWILQARPITAFGSAEADDASDAPTPSPESTLLVHGLGAAPGRASGPVRIVTSREEAHAVAAGDVLVTRMTAPDWVPLMRRAAAIVTDSGGMTCHAAIVSRELGIPCVVGTSDATTVLRAGQRVTVDATHGDVRTEDGAAENAAPRTPAAVTGPARAPAGPVTGTRLLVNLSEPSQIATAAALDVEGVGLLRAELLVLEALDGVHPRRFVEQHREGEVVDRIATALTAFARAFAPRPITYRTIDFRTNEFRSLEGGERFEPEEANPMIGFRGALRYVHDPELLRLELDAVARVWDAGCTNLHLMLPFVRTTAELRRCRALVAEAGLLERPGFELWVMAEVPSVLFNLERYAALGIAGISIGTNDLTQLLLGADRDSELLAETFDERDDAVQDYLRQLVPRARELGLRTSICGQAPSVHPEYADLLVQAGIDAISVNLDVVDRTRRLIAAAEQRLLLAHARSTEWRRA